MELVSGKSQGPLILLHGGASSEAPDFAKLRSAVAALAGIAEQCFSAISRLEPCDVVVEALRAMEADPQFNAGLGGALQRDGVVRVSAGLMDGARQSFSGVINALAVKHPSLIARWLQGQRCRVLGHPGVESLVAELKLPAEDLVTESRLADWKKEIERGVSDTVGCVVRDRHGALAAGTSTAGRPMQSAGRVSDSATVAGNYASAVAAISTTGVGEQIVDDALAARLETRCRDGMSLRDAAQRCFDEAVERARNYGWIAVHRDGEWVAAHTTPSMSFVVRGEEGVLHRTRFDETPSLDPRSPDA